MMSQYTFVHFEATIEVRDQKALVAVAIQIGQTHAVLVGSQRRELRFAFSRFRAAGFVMAWNSTEGGPILAE
jgi:hypothetical protein